VTPELKKIFAQRQIEVIPIEVGAQLLLEELQDHHQDTVQVVMENPSMPFTQKTTGELVGQST
jgi:hypothetical protein